jgi:hypothetical protein
MKRLAILPIVFATFCFSGLYLRAVQDEVTTLEGVVLRQDTNDPIPDVRVIVVRQSPAGTPSAAVPAAKQGAPVAGPLTAVTDEGGRFVIRNVPLGAVTIRAQAVGYFGIAADGVNPELAALTATLARDTPEMRLYLIPGGSIRGRVFDPLGRPFADTQVQLFRTAYEDGQTVLRPASAKVTDDRGEYRLFRVPP